MNARGVNIARGFLIRSMPLVALVAMVVPASATTPFVHEAVDTAGDVGLYASLAVDGQGNPHISYSDYGNTALKYATKNGESWNLEVVDDRASFNPSLVLDAQGNAHISYCGGWELWYARKSGSTWIREVVDTTAPLVGYSTSLALDAQGSPHISYQDITNRDLKYASWSGGSWTLETVDAAGDVGYNTSLALDAQGNPHIGYVDDTNSLVKYATKVATYWRIEAVDVGTWCSLALDAQGSPHISYENTTSADLKYASRSGTVWTVETVDATAWNMGGFSSLELDSQGNPRIAYNDDANDVLKYASKSGSTWTKEIVDAYAPGWHASLALDAQGNPRISYYDPGVGDLRYTDSAIHLLSPLGGERWAAGSQQTVRWSGVGPVNIMLSENGGLTYPTILSSISQNLVTINVPELTSDHVRMRISRSSPYSTSDTPGYISIAPDLVSPWWTQTVDGTGDVGWNSSLALDASGNPRISYRDDTTHQLKYAGKSGGAWTLETVDASGYTTDRTSLALDSQGGPHIAYYEIYGGDLRYASKAGTNWTTEVVDGAGYVGLNASLAMDAQDNPCIAYWDQTNRDLKYARKAAGVWTLQTVDAVNDVGTSASLAIDARGHGCIAYYYSSGGDLRYATWNGASWTIETVDATNDVGSYASLALDGQDNPHVCYRDATSGLLKYATKSGDAWTIETVAVAAGWGNYASLTLDAQGNPHIVYSDATDTDLKVVSRSAGFWTTETVDATPNVGWYGSSVLDAQGNLHISYYDIGNGDLKYASAAIELGAPSPGTVWPVGGSREITWSGTGQVDLALSVDGGRTWDLLATGLTAGSHRVIVPHAPTKFAQLRLERAVPRSVSATPGLFTIQTSIALLNFAAEPSAGTGGGVQLSWSTDPGPADLAGYRLERAESASDWRTLVARTRATAYLDGDGGPGTRYRLSAVNGLGEELVLGEVGLAPARPLAAWPLPYRGGALTVSFATAGGLGGGEAEAEVTLFDLAGRVVRVVAKGSFTAGHESATWDGRDAHGARVANGIYFLRLDSGGHQERTKVVVMQ